MYWGDYSEDATVYIVWSTNDGSGAAITRAVDGSIRIYKNNGTAEKTTANGITDSEDFDTVTGTHLLAIDTSNDTGDAGFWVAGADYHVMLQGATINGQTVNRWIASFSIENRLTSNIYSDTTIVVSDTTAIHSDTTIATSDLVQIYSDTTAIHSDTTAIHSDTSAIHVDTANIYSDTTIIASDVVQIYSDTTVVVSDTTAIHSDTTIIASDVVVIVSDTTKIESDVAVVETASNWVAYDGPRGTGIYLNDAAANTNTTFGTDGTVSNPVSTIAAAKTIADAQSIDRIYLVNNSDITLGATMTDYEFVGIGEVTANVINLNSIDVSRSAFYNLTIEGVQGGTGRIYAECCALQDPGAGATTLHIFAFQCGIVDSIEVDTSNDNVFDSCYSLVAGSGTPSIVATGAAGTIAVRHYSGGIEFQSLSASHNVSLETDGQVVFNANCNVNATVVLRGNMTITDNTGGMAALTTDAVYDKRAQITTIASDLVLVYSDTTAIHSDTTIVASDIVQVYSDTTAIHSDTTIIASDVVLIYSDTTVIEAAGGVADWTAGQRTTILSDLAAIESETIVVHSETTVIQSDTTAIHSDTTIIASDVVLLYSDTTAIHSDTTIIASDVVMVYSDTTAIHSDTTIIASDIVALNDISAADVNTQVLDVLNTDTFAEPAAVPGATATIVDMLHWVFTLSRNKLTQTATTATLRNDADGADIAASTVSDDGTTFTRGEYT